MSEKAESPKDEVPSWFVDKLSEFLKQAKKAGDDRFLEGFAAMVGEMNESISKAEEHNRQVQLANFKHKLALITFNGAIIALVVGSAHTIQYTRLAFLLLFFSFAVGMIHIITFYVFNQYRFAVDKQEVKKNREVANFCKSHPDDPHAVDDARAFFRAQLLAIEHKQFDNIPSLLRHMNKRNNTATILLTTLLPDFFFYVPFIVCFVFIFYDVYRYLSP